jgi:kinesin family protein 3/17
MGTNFSKEPLSSKELGVVPRSINFLFEKIKDLSHDFDFIIKVCYLELYNEEIRDLINVSM